MLLQQSLLPDVKHKALESGRVERPDAFAIVRHLVAKTGHKPINPTDTDRAMSIQHVMRAGGCERPIRLSGNGQRIDCDTGEILGTWSTSNLPSGVAYVACKTRRRSKCAVCSWLYQGDAYQLIHAGLQGGKDTPEEVSTHPALFVTLTAPSFGRVHTQRKDSQGGIRPCQSGKEAKCFHGWSLTCNQRHGDDDPLVGQALCPRCYDFESAVLWNAHSSELWRRTRIQLDRELSKRLHVRRSELKDHLRLQYVKVAEFQKRGLIHFHMVVRVDGPTVDADSPIDVATLIDSLESACKAVKVRLPNGRRARWGTQRSFEVIAADDAPVTRGQAAGYLAKYSIKGADGNDGLDQRIRHESQIRITPVNNHLRRMVRCSWEGHESRPELRGQAWAHQLGYRGHFMTKSRKWSTTFSALRQARIEHVQSVRKTSWQSLSETTLETVQAKWEYVGNGYMTAADKWLAELIRDRKEGKHRKEGPNECANSGSIA